MRPQLFKHNAWITQWEVLEPGSNLGLWDTETYSDILHPSPGSSTLKQQGCPSFSASFLSQSVSAAGP